MLCYSTYALRSGHATLAERERLWCSSGHGWGGLVQLAEFVEPVRERTVAADCLGPTLGGFATGSDSDQQFRGASGPQDFAGGLHDVTGGYPRRVHELRGGSRAR